MLRIPPSLIFSKPLAVIGLLNGILAFFCCGAGSIHYVRRGQKRSWTAMTAGLLLVNIVGTLMQLAEASFIYTDTDDTALFLVARNWTYGVSILALVLVQIEIQLVFSRGLMLPSVLGPQYRKQLYAGMITLNIVLCSFNYVEGVAFPIQDGSSWKSLLTSFGPGLMAMLVAFNGLFQTIFIVYHVRRHMVKMMEAFSPETSQGASSIMAHEFSDSTSPTAEPPLPTIAQPSVPATSHLNPTRTAKKRFNRLSQNNQREQQQVMLDIIMWVLGLLIIDMLTSIAFLASYATFGSSDVDILLNRTALRQISFALAGIHLYGETVLLTMIIDRIRKSQKGQSAGKESEDPDPLAG
ncbi:hypothetical protein BC831DRAFT_516618 [Entophlyctis helioformis]|nr:hypothetical protein BC831DRAFT_516618 [Entophlyctis helioformis]